MFLFILFIIAMVLLIKNVRVVPQGHEFIVERLGKYAATWETGLHIKIPFIDRVVRKISVKERLLDSEPSPVITKDNITIMVDSVIFFQVFDSKLYTYGVDNPIQSLNLLANTTLRNIFGSLEFDDALTSRDEINARALQILDEATDPWGIKVNRVELKQLQPPRDVQDAMERQMKAERERRAIITESEGRKKAAILQAEGDKESRVLRAEADKQEMLLRAEAEAEAIKQKAQAQAQALRMKYEATKDSFEMLNNLNFTSATLQVRSLEALERVADGKSTKLIIPSELQNIASLTATVSEALNIKPTAKSSDVTQSNTDDAESSQVTADEVKKLQSSLKAAEARARDAEQRAKRAAQQAQDVIQRYNEVTEQ